MRYLLLPTLSCIRGGKPNVGYLARQAAAAAAKAATALALEQARLQALREQVVEVHAQLQQGAHRVPPSRHLLHSHH